ncbi:MAG: cupin domain-containing protein [Egibacteraceae bacterium]
MDDAATTATVGEIGGKVRRLRREKDLSMQRLAELSGVSAATIHKIEHSSMVPTITTLMKLAVALGRSVASFVGEDDIGKPVVFTPAAQRLPIMTSRQGLQLQGFSGPYGQFLLAGAVAIIQPHAISGSQPMEHPGEELVLLLEGQLEFTVERHRHRLGVGDALHFRTDRPHSWCNPSDHQARAVWMAIRSR